MKRSKRILFLFLLLPALLGCAWALSHCFQTVVHSENETFTAFTEDLFRSQIASDTLTLHYTLANPAAYEISELSASLPLYSEESRVLSAAALENVRETLHAFSRESLSAENQLTYDILTCQIQKELTLASYTYYEEIFSPTLGTQAQLPILLSEYTFRTEQDIQNYLALLEQLDRYYESLLEYQQQKSAAGLFMSDETADAVIAQCSEFISNPGSHFLLSTFEERISNVDFLTEDAKASYETANRTALFSHVFPAYERLIDGLAALKGTGTNPYGLSYYEHGCDYYEALVDCTVGSARSMAEILSLVEQQMDSDLKTIASLLTEHPELLKSANYTIDAQEPLYILESLEQKIQADFPAVDAAAYEVKYVDPSLEDYLSPAFYLTPPLDEMENHVIYINPAGNYDNLSLFTTLAHEGYPGHLYQTLYENSCHFNLARNLFYFGGYVEGWATYIERYAYTYTSLEPEIAQLLAANSFLSLGLHARADIGIHYEGWTPEGLADFLSDYGITNSDTIEAIYQAIVQDPGNYLKYYLGAAEILQLKATAEKSLGSAFVLKDFHEFLLSVGPAPFSVIENYLSAWIKEQL